MLKYILFIAVSTSLGFYTWKKYYSDGPNEQNKPSAPILTETQSQNETENNANTKTFKDENLHKAFAKILSIEKNKKRRYTVDELILAFRKNKKIQMTLKEIDLIIARLEEEILKEERKYAIAGSEGHDVEELEANIVYKKEELEVIKLMKFKHAGVEIEN